AAGDAAGRQELRAAGHERRECRRAAHAPEEVPPGPLLQEALEAVEPGIPLTDRHRSPPHEHSALAVGASVAAFWSKGRTTSRTDRGRGGGRRGAAPRLSADREGGGGRSAVRVPAGGRSADA